MDFYRGTNNFVSDVIEGCWVDGHGASECKRWTARLHARQARVAGHGTKRVPKTQTFDR
jgi:hypothetical protein